MRRRSAPGWVLLALLSLTLLAGCGDVSLPSLDLPSLGLPSFGGSGPATPTAGPGSSVKVGGSLPTGFPSAFPLPGGYQVQSAADDGRQVVVALTVPSAQAAYDYYKGALPGAGYQVSERGTTSLPGGGFAGALTVTGNGFSGELAFTSAPAQLVTIRLEKGGASVPGNVPVAATAVGVATAMATTVPAIGAPPSGAVPGKGDVKPGGPAGALPAAFPPSFPLPPQYQLQTASDDGKQLVAVLGVTSAQAAYDFYRGALPLAGYQVRDEGGSSSSSGVFTGNLALSGQGFGGKIAFTGAGASQLVTIGLERGGAALPPVSATKPAVAATPPVAAPTAAATSVPTRPAPAPTVASKPGGGGVGGLPANFPLPPDHRVQTAADNGQQIAVILVVPSAADAYEFFKKALAEAGYQVTERGSVTSGGTFAGSLSVRGNGFSGDVACTNASGTQMAVISLTRG